MSFSSALFVRLPIFGNMTKLLPVYCIHVDRVQKSPIHDHCGISNGKGAKGDAERTPDRPLPSCNDTDRITGVTFIDPEPRCVFRRFYQIENRAGTIQQCQRGNPGRASAPGGERKPSDRVEKCDRRRYRKWKGRGFRSGTVSFSTTKKTGQWLTRNFIDVLSQHTNKFALCPRFSLYLKEYRIRFGNLSENKFSFDCSPLLLYLLL